MSFSFDSILDSATSSIGGVLGDVFESVGDFAGGALNGISDAAKQFVDDAGNVWVGEVVSDMQFEKGNNGNVAADLPASSDNAGNISSNSHASIKNGLSPALTIGLAVGFTVTVVAGVVIATSHRG